MTSFRDTGEALLRNTLAGRNSSLAEGGLNPSEA